MNAGKIVVGLLAGAALSAAVGMLLAPENGSATIKKIAGKKEEYTEIIKGRIVDFLLSLIDKISIVKEGSEGVERKRRTASESQ